MNIKNLLNVDSIILDEHSLNKNDAIEKLINKHYECGHIIDKDLFKKSILEREEMSSTGVGNFIAIPHTQSETVKYPSLVAMVDKEGVDFESLDQTPAKVLFMIAVPKNSGNDHLEILAQLSQILMNDKIVRKLLNAQTAKHFIDILTGEMGYEKEKHLEKYFDVVAVTACPTGIAHTYMAAKSLEDTAKKLGIKIKVETNGASGIKNELTKEDIEQAKGVIIAADKKVETSRFAGKYMIEVPVAKGIHEPDKLINEAVTHEISTLSDKDEKPVKKDYKFVKNFYNHLMNGVSHIIPILMIYGIIKQIMVWFGMNQYYYDYSGVGLEWIQNVDLQYLLLIVITFSGYIFAAFIAESISDLPGFTVTLFSLMISRNHNFSIVGMIIIGFISGYIVLGFKKLFSYIPEILETLVPNLLLPLSGTIAMIFLLTFIPENIYDLQFQQLSIISSPIFLIVVGFILGAMMSIDMGGPINKTAYCIGIIGIFLNRFDLMSAVMIAGMVPPIVIWLSILVYPQLFNKGEQLGKWRCLVKGLCFVSEEAIPYMTNNKMGIHIPCIIASGIAGALSMYFGCSQMFPHGGIITLPFINNSKFFVLTLIASTLVGMTLVIMLKKAQEN